MAVIRWLLGKIILIVNRLTLPRPLQRSPEAQQRIDQQTRKMALYQFHACPFCVKVRRALHRYNLTIELRDAKNDPVSRQELAEQGGRIKVPCLRIYNDDGSDSWMYESSDIIRYLEQRFVDSPS